MSELAERFEVLVEAFARKIAALSIDAAEQKGRADRAEAEVERLRVEYEPGYPVDRDAPVDAPVLDDERKELCDEINKWKSRYFRATDVMAAEKKRADEFEDESRHRLRLWNEETERIRDERESLRAGLAAANEEIARLKRELDAAVEYHADFAKRIELALGSDALDDFNGPRLERLETSIGIMREAHAATTAKLGRAVDILEDLARRGGLGWETHERIRAILADADRKVKP
jgi:hypothetical protein